MEILIFEQLNICEHSINLISLQGRMGLGGGEGGKLHYMSQSMIIVRRKNVVKYYSFCSCQSQFSTQDL